MADLPHYLAQAPLAALLSWLGLWSYTQPLLALSVLLILAGLLRLRFRHKAALAWIGLASLVLISWPPAEWLFSRPLEARYAIEPFHAPPTVQAIVVLSGAVDPPTRARPYPLPDHDTFSKCEFAAWIHRGSPRLPVLASGASPGDQLPAAVTMRDLLIRAGVPHSMVWTEERSHDTYENAVNSAAILRQHGMREIALVVDARSMPRAAACFRKQGIAVVPAPSTLREWGSFREELIPSWKAIHGNETTLHEAAGLVSYWLSGRI